MFNLALAINDDGCEDCGGDSTPQTLPASSLLSNHRCVHPAVGWGLHPTAQMPPTDNWRYVKHECAEEQGLRYISVKRERN